MELQELRDYAAIHIMGWIKKSDGIADYWWSPTTGWKMLCKLWVPDNNHIGQIWMITKKMQSMGFRLEFYMEYNEPYVAKFIGIRYFVRKGDAYKTQGKAIDDSPSSAVLKAAVEVMKNIFKNDPMGYQKTR